MDPITEAPGLCMKRTLLPFNILHLNGLKVVFARCSLLKDRPTDRVSVLMKAFNVRRWHYERPLRWGTSLLGIQMHFYEILLSSLDGVRIRKIECVEVVSLLVQIRIVVSTNLESLLSLVVDRELREGLVLSISNRVISHLHTRSRNVIGNLKRWVFGRIGLLILELF